jgi:NAD(P)-dependent dehydrogenase (short-subunit alcohol dehydrogenase family)
LTLAVVIGSTGGIGAALLTALGDGGEFSEVIGLGRTTTPGLDLQDEASIVAAVASLAGREVRLVIDATGFLHDTRFSPERSWRQLDAAHMAHAFAVNAIGPALLMKHILPALPRQGRVVFASLSARVGSIGDNRLGGWYSYRASKAALNQLVRCAAIELARINRDSVCVALHPGTVDTGLSGPFAKTGLDVQTPGQSAARILSVLGTLTPAQSGGFFDQNGIAVPF